LALLATVLICLGAQAQNVGELTQKARSGNSAAQLTLGEMYLYGSGVEVNMDSALHWLHRASTDYAVAASHLINLGVRTGEDDVDRSVYLTWLNMENHVSEPEYSLELQGNQYVWPSQKIVATVNGGDSIYMHCDDMKYIQQTIPLIAGVNVVRVFRQNSFKKMECLIERPVVYTPRESARDISSAQPARAVDVAAPRVIRMAALVMGNSAYLMGALRNPVNDATDMAAKLETMGFDVTLATNLSQRGMEGAVIDFARKVQDYEVVLFFYAGHGLQVSGENYLVPVDAMITSESDAKYKCQNANMILDLLDEANVGLKIIILDACRNNPFARSLGRGLASMSSPSGTFLAFATSPGDVALDGRTRNSPYTSAILRHIDAPGISIYECFQNISEDVSRTTKEHQNPWISASLRSMFYFNR